MSDPAFMPKAMSLRTAVTTGSDAQIGELLGDCFGFDGPARTTAVAAIRRVIRPEPRDGAASRGPVCMIEHDLNSYLGTLAHERTVALGLEEVEMEFARIGDPDDPLALVRRRFADRPQYDFKLEPILNWTLELKRGSTRLKDQREHRSAAPNQTSRVR